MTHPSLADLGWSDHFAHQVDDPTQIPMRISAVHRDRLSALSANGPCTLFPSEQTSAYATGDWVTSDSSGTVTQRLAPKTDLLRRAAGHDTSTQRIAANVDTVAIVSSCNADFNIPRLERFLAIVTASGALPLVVLTKSDTTDDAETYVHQAEQISPLVTAIALNARDSQDASRLDPWCRNGQTLALLGTSGVGKTTLRNVLTTEIGATKAIREDDARGRHTTTARTLHPTNAGGWLIDTPGMREVQLTEAADGIASLFDDIEDLATQCRFRNCAHASEPGCAVQSALGEGILEQDRFERWQKLSLEDARNSQTLAQAHAKDRAFGKMVRDATSAKKRGR